MSLRVTAQENPWQGMRKPSEFPVLHPRQISGIEKTKSAVKTFFEKINSFWTFIGKSFSVLRHGLRVALYSAKDALRFERRSKTLNPAIAGLGVASVMSIPMNIKDMGEEFESMREQVRIQDREGFALAALSTSILAADSVDSYISFSASMGKLMPFPQFGLLSVIGLPLVYFLIGASAVSHGYRILQTSSLLLRERIFKDKELLQNPGLLQKEMHAFLEKQLGITEEEKQRIKEKAEGSPNRLLKRNMETINLLERKEKALERKVGKEMLVQLKKIHAEMNKNQSVSQDRLVRVIQNVKKASVRNIAIRIMKVVAIVFGSLALIAFTMTVAPYIPYLFLAISAAVRLGVRIYEKCFQNKGLELDPQGSELDPQDSELDPPRTLKQANI